MKKFIKTITAILCVAVLSIPCFAAACTPSDEKPEHVDYASQLKLDLSSNTKKQEVTLRKHVDGDTTHFDPVQNSKLLGCNNAADFSSASAPETTKGYAKARYMGINTPESTGRIEPYGDAASKFTKSKVESAKSIIIESNDDKWNIDSTGERYVLWVWYIPEDGTEYRNLNIEILQSGYAWGSSVYDADNLYRDASIGALEQAQAEKLIIFSGEKDPGFHYGDAIPVDLKELRLNTEEYANKKIAVKGLVVADFNNTVYIEEVYTDDDGNDYRLGISVFYAYTVGYVLDVLSVGNYVSVVGVVKYSDYNGCYQITDIHTYDFFGSNDNCEIVEERNLEKAFTSVDIDKYKNNPDLNFEVTKTRENEAGEQEEYLDTVTIKYRDSLMATSLSLDNLYVYDSYTTKTEGASKGAMTLYCRAADGTEVQIRTEVLKEDGVTVTADRYVDKTISVKGVLEQYNDSRNGWIYQVKVHRPDYITVK
ncbi:MAG: thermonuclease family protein [Clostridia bacterium]|nr:thermonuclease family protein [Clostridia bacterium]